MLKMEITKIVFFILLNIVLLSCDFNRQKETQLNRNINISNNNCKDILWGKILRVRKKIYDKSKISKEEILQNFNKSDDYIYKFYALKAIHKDSLQIHAPLKIINDLVEEYNNYCKVNIKNLRWIQLPKFNNVDEYRDKNIICIILQNELTIYKSFGYR